MPTVTLETLRARAREYADQSGSDVVEDTSTSLDGYINDAVQELRSITADSYGPALSVQAPIVAVIDQEAYSLPTDLFRITSVEYFDEPMLPYGYLVQGIRNACCPRWRQEGLTNIRFLPAPQSEGGVIRVWYIPNYATLSSSTASLTVPPHGDAFIAVAAALPCVAKEERDFAFLLGRKRELQEKIELEGWRHRPKAGTLDVRNHKCPRSS